jgi:hypothetical protein
MNILPLVQDWTVRLVGQGRLPFDFIQTTALPVGSSPIQAVTTVAVRLDLELQQCDLVSAEKVGEPHEPGQI